MKKIVSLLLVSIILATFVAAPVSAEAEIDVLVNGEVVESDVPAKTIPVYDEDGNYIGDRVMLPLRAVAEKLNADVYWDGETSGITMYRKNKLYLMWLDADTAFCLGGLSLEKAYVMDVPPLVVESRTLVPVRAVGEILGAKVEWVKENNSVSITADLGELENNAGVAEGCNVYQRVLGAMYDEYKSYADGTIEKVTGKFVLDSGEEIKFEIYPMLAPETCANFIKLAKGKYYDGTIFHRVINDFVAQGGGFDAEEKEKPSDVVVGEFIMNGFLNLIPHDRGAISLARPNDYNGGSSQFFIVQKDAPHLDGNYAAFGYVTDGMDIVDRICEAETDGNDKPVMPIVVKQVIIDE
ncbi:MAG: peptidylprolyl isomerase [Eubacteriales bacterium]|nr:peptidylprolyl isomerase [Eubacteriales bacterium]